MKYIPNILLVIALLLTIVDLIWPTPKLLQVSVLLTIIALVAEPVVLRAPTP